MKEDCWNCKNIVCDAYIEWQIKVFWSHRALDIFTPLPSRFMKLSFKRTFWEAVNLHICKAESIAAELNILTRVLSVYIPLFYLVLKYSLRNSEEGWEIIKTIVFLLWDFIYLMDWFSSLVHRAVEVSFLLPVTEVSSYNFLVQKNMPTLYPLPLPLDLTCAVLQTA